MTAETAAERYMGELPMPAPGIVAETCSKCGASEPMIRYHNGGSGRDGCNWNASVHDYCEHLHLTCRTCHYEWTRPTLDANRQAAKEEPE